MPSPMIFMPKAMYNGKSNCQNIIGGIIAGDHHRRKPFSNRENNTKLKEVGAKLEALSQSKLKPSNITF